MAKQKKDKEIEEKAETQEVTEKNSNLSSIQAILKANEKDHFNFEKEVFYTVSSNSLTVDAAMNGGFCPGLHRLTGVCESGKTSEALEIARAFLDTFPEDGKICLVKAEGRLSPEMKKRTGLKFIYDVKDWVAGSVFVLESNIYELVIDIFRDLVYNNPDNIKYCFIVDSMDGLQIRSDADKTIDENSKVAGAPALTKKMLQKMALAMSKKGHILLMISQHTIAIELSAYAPKEWRPVKSSGGNAVSHWANWMLEFSPNYNNEKILKNPSKPFSPENKAVGHYAKGYFRKSSNETTGQEFRYPIKYGVVGGSSIWREREIVDFALMNELIKKGGAWYTLDKSFIKDLTDAGFEPKEQYNGTEKIVDWLEANPNITDFLYKKFREIVNKNVIVNTSNE